MECLTLKKSNCKNCYKCIRHCPVKSIRFTGNQAYIIADECIMCGQCFVVCPQNAKQITDETEKVKVFLQSGVPVVVSLAPSFIANFDGVGIESMRDALKQLGFYDVEETAIGATIVKREYDRICNEEGRDIILTTCCHSANLLVQKHFPKLIPYLADVLSPMQAHCKDIKKRIPNAKTVFIGPCVAKKDEAQRYEGLVDAVLTFDEISAWLKSKNIVPEKKLDHDDNSRARFFPTTGGILKTMAMENPEYTYMAIDGTRNCIMTLKEIEAGNVHHAFIEMSACVGSCIGGPVMEKFHAAPVKDYVAVARYAGKNDFTVAQPDRTETIKDFNIIEHQSRMPSEYDIKETLKQMGKLKPEDELNCGTCGYDTCREKAIAILQGKADISMCLPFLKERAENFSDTITRNSPNGILVLNDSLEVQQVNRAALRILNLRSANDILGDLVVRVLDPGDFLKILGTGGSIHDKREYLAEYRKYVEKTIVYDREYNSIFCMLRDVTEEESEKEKRQDISRQTMEIADKVVDKQMRIVQEIASLLGETAAETKIALTKLKESIKDE